MILQGFIGSAYRTTSPNVAIETLYNWIPQTVEAAEPERIVYIPRPGLANFLTLPTVPLRALFAQDGRAWAVGGQVIYEIFSTMSAIARGTLSGYDGNPATISSSGTAGHQLYITSGGLGDILDINTNALTPITSGGYPLNTAMGTYLDSYFLTTKGSSAQFNISNLLDGTIWSSLDFAVRIAASDNLVGIIEYNKVIWLVGSQTSEPWYDSGASSFPFQSVPQVLIPVGCCAPFSIVRQSNNIFWLHQSERGRGIFVGVGTYNPQRLSTYAVEAIWGTYTTITDAVAFAMTWQGHELIVISFQTGNATWVYDATESALQGSPVWSQWSYFNPVTAKPDRFRGWMHCQAFNQHLVGDWFNGNIYNLDPTIGTDNGDQIVWERTSPHLKDEQIVHYYANFQLDMEAGLGGLTPTARLNWSDDGGHTFNSPVEMPMGAVGTYPTRCRAAGSLGQSRDRVFRVRISNTVPPPVLAAHCDILKGTS